MYPVSWLGAPPPSQPSAEMLQGVCRRRVKLGANLHVCQVAGPLLPKLAPFAAVVQARDARHAKKHAIGSAEVLFAGEDACQARYIVVVRKATRCLPRYMHQGSPPNWRCSEWAISNMFMELKLEYRPL